MSWWRRRRQRRPEPIPSPADSVAAAQALDAAASSEAGYTIAAADPWRPLAAQFALRLLTLTWEAVHHIGQAEEGELDPHRREQLFRIDHAITRARRLAENLRILTGESVEDPDRQVVTLQDIAHAAGSSAEHYERLRFGPIADLAVSADAADDVIRVLTELIDNGDRYSLPDRPVTVAGHFTSDGDVLIRVEDNGLGIPADRLDELNDLLSKQGELRAVDLHPSAVGLPVVALLTRRHPGLQAWLTPRSSGGTVAMLRIGGQLLCEIPFGQQSIAAPPLPPRHAQASADPTPARQRAIPRPRPGVPPLPPAAAFDPGSTAVLPAVTGSAATPMPSRTPGSIRGEAPAPAVPAATYTTAWHDDAAAFSAGVDAALDRLASSPRRTGA